MPKAALAASLTLCAFRAAAFDAAGGSLPSRLVICPAGTSDARERGKVIVNADTFAGLTERQNAAKLGMRLALDAEHCTVPGTSAYLAEKEPRTVLAWATLSGDVKTGLVYENIEWTPLGVEAHKNKQFQDISPAVFRRADGTVIAVHSAALCRQGEIDGLTLEAAAAGAQLAPFFAALSANLTPTTLTTDPMKDLLLTILKALGLDLAADADDAAIETAAKGAPEKINALLKAPPAAMTADMQALQTQLTTLSGEVKTLTDERDTYARNELVRQAATEGKVIPLSAEVIAVTPLNVLKEIVKQAKPNEVPLGRTTTTTEKTKDEPEAFTAETAAVFSKMGLSKEDFEKFGPKSAAA